MADDEGIDEARFEAAVRTSRDVLVLLREKHTPSEAALVLAMTMGRVIVASEASDEAVEALFESARSYIKEMRQIT